MRADTRKHIVGKGMPDAARFVRRSFRRDTQRRKTSRAHAVARVNTDGTRLPRSRQQDIAAILHRYIPRGAQLSNGATDARLGKAHFPGNIRRTDGAVFLSEKINRLETVLVGLPYARCQCVSTYPILRSEIVSFTYPDFEARVWQSRQRYTPPAFPLPQAN